MKLSAFSVALRTGGRFVTPLADRLLAPEVAVSNARACAVVLAQARVDRVEALLFVDRLDQRRARHTA